MNDREGGRCPNCGATITTETQFCPNCGQAVASSPSRVRTFFFPETLAKGSLLATVFGGFAILGSCVTTAAGAITFLAGLRWIGAIVFAIGLLWSIPFLLIPLAVKLEGRAWEKRPREK